MTIHPPDTPSEARPFRLFSFIPARMVPKRSFHPAGRRNGVGFYLKIIYGLAGLIFLLTTAFFRPAKEYEPYRSDLRLDIPPSSLLWTWLPSDSTVIAQPSAEGGEFPVTQEAPAEKDVNFPWGTTVKGENIKLWMSRGAEKYIEYGSLAVVISLLGSILWLLCTEWPARPMLPLPHKPSMWRRTLKVGGKSTLDAVDTLPKIFLLLAMYTIDGLTVTKFTIGMGIFLMLGSAAILRTRLEQYLATERYIYALELGQRPYRIFFKHFLCRESISLVLVQIPFALCSFILYETTIAYIGLSLSDMHSWGQLLKENYDFRSYSHWAFAIPLLSLFLVITSLYLLSDAMKNLFVSRET